MYVLMLSAIPIVIPVVSYWLMILNSSIILVMLRTVNCCISILTLFKMVLWQRRETECRQNYVYIFTIKTDCIYFALNLIVLLSLVKCV